MGVRVSDLMLDAREIEIPVGKDVLHVTYRPSKMTPVDQQRYMNVLRDELSGPAIVTILFDMLLSWDLLDDEGKPLPISKKTLSTLPIRFLGQLLAKINEDLSSPNVQSAGVSGAGSLATG